jgi:hypothetical protein
MDTVILTPANLLMLKSFLCKLPSCIPIGCIMDTAILTPANLPMLKSCLYKLLSSMTKGHTNMTPFTALNYEDICIQNVSNLCALVLVHKYVLLYIEKCLFAFSLSM